MTILKINLIIRLKINTKNKAKSYVNEDDSNQDDGFSVVIALLAVGQAAEFYAVRPGLVHQMYEPATIPMCILQDLYHIGNNAKAHSVKMAFDKAL